MVIDKIPLEVFTVESGFHANIEIEIDGHKAKVLLDTGSPSSSVKTDTFISKYKTLEKKESKGVSGKGYFFEVFQPKKVIVGSQNIYGPKLIRGVDKGVLGLNILEKNIFQYDLRNKSLNILSALPNHKYKLKRLKAGHLTIQIKFGDKNTYGLFDTGSDATIVDSRFIQDNPELFRLKRSEAGKDAHGNQVESKVYECSHIKVGKLELKNVEVATFNFPDFLRDKMEGTPAILGNNIIGVGKWSFDIKNKKWTFENSL